MHVYGCRLPVGNGRQATLNRGSAPKILPRPVSNGRMVQISKRILFIQYIRTAVYMHDGEQTQQVPVVNWRHVQTSAVVWGCMHEYRVIEHFVTKKRSRPSRKLRDNAITDI